MDHISCAAKNPPFCSRYCRNSFGTSPLLITIVHKRRSDAHSRSHFAHHLQASSQPGTPSQTDTVKRTDSPAATCDDVGQLGDLTSALSLATGAPKQTAVSFTLPPKNDLIIWTFLSREQQQIYEMFLESKLVDALKNTSQSVLAALTVLKKLCDHPRLLRTQNARHLEALGLHAEINNDLTGDSRMEEKEDDAEENDNFGMYFMWRRCNLIFNTNPFRCLPTGGS